MVKRLFHYDVYKDVAVMLCGRKVGIMLSLRLFQKLLILAIGLLLTGTIKYSMIHRIDVSGGKGGTVFEPIL